MPKGDTLVEPTVVVTPTTAGSVTLQPSVAGLTDPTSGITSYTTAGVFTPASGYLGPVTLSAEVQGVDDSDATFNVIAVPAPETVAFDPTGFHVQPIAT